jgi:hypothetical protein
MASFQVYEDVSDSERAQWAVSLDHKFVYISRHHHGKVKEWGFHGIFDS